MDILTKKKIIVGYVTAITIAEHVLLIALASGGVTRMPREPVTVSIRDAINKVWFDIAGFDDDGLLNKDIEEMVSEVADNLVKYILRSE